MFVFMLQVYSDADLKSYKRDVVTKERKLRAGVDYPCDCYFNIGLHVYSDPNSKSYKKDKALHISGGLWFYAFTPRAFRYSKFRIVFPALSSLLTTP
jgi:hypothetical protein